MSKFILASRNYDEIYINGIKPESLCDLSEKVFVNKYGHKSRATLINEAALGNTSNFRLLLVIKVGNTMIQLQSEPITADRARSLGFTPDEEIEIYTDIGGMIKKLRQ